MAFNNGVWTPDQNQMQSQGGQPSMQQPAPAQQSGRMGQQPSYQQPPAQQQGMQPPMQQSSPSGYGYLSQMPGVQAARGMNIAPVTSSPYALTPMTPGLGGSYGQQAPQLGNWGGYYPQQQPMQSSVEQSVNNNNPQSVQNFLSALNKTGASGNNGWQNPQGMQGQGPQGGFQGFQQNGMQMAPQNQWQGYSQNYQPQLGSYKDQATGGGNVTNGAGGQFAGGTGGNQAQPQYQTPVAPPAPPANPYAGVQGQNFNSQASLMQATQQAAYNTQKAAGGTPNPSLIATSDVSAKQNISQAHDELQDFLNHLGVYSYEYKDPKYGEGRRISPMAQEIEASALGKEAISTNSEGYKQVDYGKLMGTQLAATAMLNHKYNELEAQLKSAIQNGLRNKGKK